MTAVKVAIPVYRGKRKFFLDKGRPWSVVEHLILAALSTRPSSALELAKAGNLPRRLVIEILIRLMRAGWVELDERHGGVQFRATGAGAANAIRDELPSAPKRMSRWMNFIIDRITGSVYRSREMPFHHAEEVKARALRELIVFLEPRDVPANYGVHDLVDCLFSEDERFVSVDPSGDRLMDRYALVTVRGDEIEGLPARAPEELSRLVREAAKKARGLSVGTRQHVYRSEDPLLVGEGSRPPAVSMVFSPDDLIIGGQAHRTAFERMLKEARRRVVIHSTFVRVDRFNEQLPILADAAKAGVLVDILWGEGDRPGHEGKTRAAVKLIRSQLEAAGLDEMIRLHSFTTRSHAKFILADRGDRFVGLVGSCNWFTTDFSNFEVSARLRDPEIVGQLTYAAAELSRGAHGLWTNLTTSLAQLADDARRASPPSGPKVLGQLVIGPQHKAYVRDARDHAHRSITVASHLLAPAARQAVLVPALAAPVPGLVRRCYHEHGQVTQGGHPEAFADVEFIQAPSLHAKLLAWDDDNLVVTSQNWLSADPSQANPLREIGVFLCSPGLATSVTQALAAAAERSVR